MIAFPSRTEVHRLSLVLSLVGACTALASCHSDEIPIDELPAELEHRLCARAAACGGAESQTSCESTVFIAESSSVKTLVEAVKRGTIDYDGKSASACLEAYTTDCAELQEPAACDEVFHGTVPAAGACVTSAECVSNRCAFPDTCTAACCVGACEAVVAPVALGAACDVLAYPNPCVEGAFCLEGTCTARRAPGAACTGAPDECLEPAVCLYRPDGSGETCTVISTAPGAACVPGANFGCGRDDETCNATTSLCTKLAAPGAACASSADCVSYASCDTATGTCTLRPRLGEACDNTTARYCVGGLSCTNGICSEPAPGVACVP